MYKRNKERGITLIALVVTIIILLILATVSLSMLTGENGILTNAKLARENTTKGQLQEELQMAINEIQLEKTTKGEPLSKKDIAEYLSSSKGAIVIDYTDEMIDGEYGDYQFVVEKSNKVTIGGKLTGAKPTIEFTKSTNEEGVDNLQLTVKGSTLDGDIA